MPPLGVSQVNSIPTYLTDEKGNPLTRVQGPNGAYGAPVAVVGFDDLVLDPLTQRLDAMLAGPKAKAVTPYAIAGSTAAVVLLPPNASRRTFRIYNDSSAVLYVKFGPAASATDFAFLLLGNGSGVGGYYEDTTGYTGLVTGAWASATGTGRVEEFS